MARSTWRGAIDIAGHPVHLSFYNRVKSRGGESFKTLGTDDRPIKQVLVESDEFAKLEADPTTKVATIGRNDTRKGVQVGADEFKPLDPEAIEGIASAERSTIIEPRSFVPRDALPIELAEKAYTVVPDEKVIGSERSAGQLWNGLRASGLAYTTEITTRAGSRDAIIAVYAKEDGLYAVALPFGHELQAVPEHEFEIDDAVGDAISNAISERYEVHEGFEHGEYVSAYQERRQTAIEAALDGKPVKVAKAPEPKADTGDLMAALEGAAKQAKPKKAPAKKRTTKKKVAA